jgi:hypothetical protein
LIMDIRRNMPEARQLHKRHGNVANTPTVAPAKPKAEEVVALKVLPVEKHESFEDFYPLHVTKTESVKENTGSGPLIFGIILIIVVAVLAFWYVKNQEEVSNITNTPTISQTPSASSTVPTMDTTTPAEETIVPVDTLAPTATTSTLPLETTSSAPLTTPTP